MHDRFCRHLTQQVSLTLALDPKREFSGGQLLPVCLVDFPRGMGRSMDEKPGAESPGSGSWPNTILMVQGSVSQTAIQKASAVDRHDERPL